MRLENDITVEMQQKSVFKPDFFSQGDPSSYPSSVFVTSGDW